MQLASIGFGFDQWYISNAFENGVTLSNVPRALGSLYITGSVGMAAQAWLILYDGITHGGPAIGSPLRPYPLPVGGFISMSWQGGIDFQNGIYVAAYSTQALAVAGGVPDAGNIIWIEGYMRRGRIPNPK